MTPAAGGYGPGGLEIAQLSLDGRRKASVGQRLRALIVLLWRAGLRISEALAIHESNLDRSGGAVLVRRGKGGKRREVGMDRVAGKHPPHANSCTTPRPPQG